MADKTKGAGGIHVNASLGVAGIQAGVQEMQALVRKGVQNTQRQFDALNKSVSLISNSFRSMGFALAGGGMLAIGQQAVQTADAMTNLKARLDNLTGSAESGKAAFEGIRQIALKTGSDIESTAQVFSRLQIGLDRPQAELLKFTESVTQLGIIGGSSAENLKNGLTQLGQSMSGPVVRAEEFNSLVENTPLIVKRIADGLGVTQGQLRQLIVKGKVLSEDVFKVLLAQSEDIQKDFEKMPLTAERGFNQVGLAVSGLVSQIDTAISGTRTLASVLDETAKLINSISAGIVTMSQAATKRAESGIVFSGASGGVDSSLPPWMRTQSKGQPQASKTILWKPDLGKTGALGSPLASAMGLGLSGGLNVSPLIKAPEDPLKATKMKYDKILRGLGGDDDKKKKKGGRQGKSDAERLAEQLKEQGKALTESLKPSADYAAQVAKLNQMMNAGAIAADVYNLALKKYQNDYGNVLKIDELIAPASERWMKNLTSSVNFDGILDGFKTQVDEVNRLADETQRKLSDGLERAQSLVLEMRSPIEVLKANLAEIDDLAQLPGSPINTSNLQTLKQNAIDLFVTQDEGYQALMNSVANYGKAFENTFVNAVMGAKFSFKDLMNSILEDLLRLTLRLTIINPLISGIGKALGQNTAQQATGQGGGGGFWGSLLGNVGSSLIKGFKGFATGGYMSEPGIVGEKGPELFFPGRGGYVMNNRQLAGAMAGAGGGGTVVNHYTTINAPGVYDTGAFAKLWADQLASNSRKVGQIGTANTQMVANRQGRRGIIDR